MRLQLRDLQIGCPIANKCGKDLCPYCGDSDKRFAHALACNSRSPHADSCLRLRPPWEIKQYLMAKYNED